MVKYISPVNILFVSKMSSRHLQDMSSRHLQDMSSRHLQDMSSRHLQDMSSRRLQDMSSRRLHRNNFLSSKTSSRRLQDVLRDIFKTSWKTKNCYAEDVLRRLQDQQMFAGVVVLENSKQKLTCSSSFGNVGGCNGQIFMELV